MQISAGKLSGNPDFMSRKAPLVEVRNGKDLRVKETMKDNDQVFFTRSPWDDDDDDDQSRHQ